MKTIVARAEDGTVIEWDVEAEDVGREVEEAMAAGLVIPGHDCVKCDVEAAE